MSLPARLLLPFSIVPARRSPPSRYRIKSTNRFGSGCRKISSNERRSVSLKRFKIRFLPCCTAQPRSVGTIRTRAFSLHSDLPKITIPTTVAGPVERYLVRATPTHARCSHSTVLNRTLFHRIRPFFSATRVASIQLGHHTPASAIRAWPNTSHSSHLLRLLGI